MKNITFVKLHKYFDEINFIKDFENETPQNFGNVLKHSLINMNMEKFEDSIFEVITSDKDVKIYFDVKGVSVNDNENEFIKKLIEDFKKFILETSEIDIGKYVLTRNKSPRCKGISYHVIFPNYYCNSFLEIRNMMFRFLHSYNKYENYIDLSIYSENYLMRSIFQKPILKNENDKYVPDKNDIHKLVKGLIGDTIIQDVTQSKHFNHYYNMDIEGILA